MYIQVNIGRRFIANKFNPVGGLLLDLAWKGLQGEVLEAVKQAGRANYVRDITGRPDWFKTQHPDSMPIELHLGTGYWGEDIEDSAHISAFWEPGFYLDQLREELLRLKKTYGQDSIALIIGSELI